MRHLFPPTFISECKAAHLGEFSEGFEADGASCHLQADDGDLVLFDEPRPQRVLVSSLLIN